MELLGKASEHGGGGEHSHGCSGGKYGAGGDGDAGGDVVMVMVCRREIQYVTDRSLNLWRTWSGDIEYNSPVAERTQGEFEYKCEYTHWETA